MTRGAEAAIAKERQRQALEVGLEERPAAVDRKPDAADDIGGRP